MSTENNSVEPVEVNLDDFAAELFGRSKAPPSQASEESQKEETPESDAVETEEDTHVDADDTSAPDNDDETGEDEDSNKKEAPKPKKNRFQERIDQAVGKQREAERQLAEALAKLAEKEESKTETTKPAKVEASDGPTPADLNEDGTEKYPLGEFDPGYIRDLMKHTLDEESKLRREQEEQEQERQRRAEAEAALQTNWNEKLVSAKERYPDFQEKGEQMLSAFEGIETAYGEYLSNTIMDMEFGPDIFYYLSSNLDVAQQIIDSGPRKATIALGRLEARFAEADEEKQKTRPRVSKAPAPPEHLNKGSAVAAPALKGDEKDIDLDEFSRQLFKKRRA